MKSEGRTVCENIGGIWVKGHYRNGTHVKPYCRLGNGSYQRFMKKTILSGMEERSLK